MSLANGLSDTEARPVLEAVERSQHLLQESVASLQQEVARLTGELATERELRGTAEAEFREAAAQSERFRQMGIRKQTEAGGYKLAMESAQIGCENAEHRLLYAHRMQDYLIAGEREAGAERDAAYESLGRDDRRARDAEQQAQSAEAALLAAKAKIAGLRTALADEARCPTCDGTGTMGGACEFCAELGYRTKDCGCCHGTGEWSDVCAECDGAKQSLRSDLAKAALAAEEREKSDAI